MRQFIAGTELNENGIISLSKKDENYLKNVLRLKQGEGIDVRLLDGRLVEMVLVKNGTDWVLQEAEPSQKKETGVSADSIATHKVEIELLQCIIKPSKMDVIMRQATECGVRTIVPIQGDLSQKFSVETRQDRWEKIIKEARQQSGSPVSTELVESMSFDDYFGSYVPLTEFQVDKKAGAINADKAPLSNAGAKKRSVLKCYLSEEIDEKTEGKNSGSVFSVISKKGKPERVVLAVGSEGGISKRERALLEAEGFAPLHFSTNILRAETATLYGIAVLQNAIMEYESWQKNE